jgi:hypothetical protein
MKANLYRPSVGPRIELSGSAAVLAWYGPYDAHETNSIAKTSRTKVFIEAFFTCATEGIV